MAIGLVNSKEFDKELVDLKIIVPSQLVIESTNEPNAQIIDQAKKGRNNTEAVPNTVRQVIAQEAIAGASAKELAKQFKVSESSISAYKNGATSTASYNKPDKELKEANNKFRDVIASSARSKLIKAIESLTDEKIESAKAKDISSIAKDMSVVINNIEPANKGLDNNGVHFHFFAPQLKAEEDYESIQAIDV